MVFTVVYRLEVHRCIWWIYSSKHFRQWYNAVYCFTNA